MKTHYFNYFNVITSVLFAGWVWSGVFFFVCRARPRHLPLHITYPRNNSIFMHQNYAIFFLWLQLKFIIIKSDSKCIYIFTMNTVRPALCERTRITILFFFYLNTSLSWISLFSFIHSSRYTASAGKLLALNQPNEENIFFHIVNYYRHEEKQ